MTLAAGQWWESGALIGWSTFFAGIAAVAVSVLLYLRGRRPEPRSELVQSLSDVRLLARDLGGEEAGNLRVMYRDTLLDSPYLVSLFVESRSEKDIASTRFDAGKPLVFSLGVAIVAALGSPSGSAVAEGCLTIENAGLVKIAPHLIRKGRVLDIEVLTEGPPLLKIDSPLIEVDIHQRGINDQRTVQAEKRFRSLSTFFDVAASTLVYVQGAFIILVIIAILAIWLSHR